MSLLEDMQRSSGVCDNDGSEIALGLILARLVLSSEQVKMPR